MTRKKLIAITLTVFLVFEIALVWLGLRIAPLFIDQKSVPVTSLRLAILPILSKEHAEKKWEPFFKKINKNQKNLLFEPYFANSYEELISAFLNGGLDLAIVEPSSFLALKKDNLASPLAYVVENASKNDGVLAVMVSNDKSYIFGETKGLRLTLTNPFSVTGCQAPMAFLKKTLPETPDLWFSKVTFAGNEYNALSDLINGDTDIIAVARGALTSILKTQEFKETDIKVLWMQKSLPENVLCCRIGLDYTKEVATGKEKDTSKKRPPLPENLSFFFRGIKYDDKDFSGYAPQFYDTDNGGFKERLRRMETIVDAMPLLKEPVKVEKKE